MVVETVAEGPDEEGGRGADVGVEDGDAGVRGGCVWSAAIEAVPADPEEAGADEDGEDVVGASGGKVRRVAGSGSATATGSEQ